MKEKELREHATCSLCRKPVMASGLPLFWTLKIERFGIKLDAVKRQQGLTMMLNGHAALAAVMGRDEDMAESVMAPVTVTVCETCAMNENQPVAQMVESGRQ